MFYLQINKMEKDSIPELPIASIMRLVKQTAPNNIFSSRYKY